MKELIVSKKLISCTMSKDFIERGSNGLNRLKRIFFYNKNYSVQIRWIS